MGTGAEFIIPAIVLGAAGTATSVAQASAQNSAAKRSQEAANKAAEAKLKQLNEQAEIERTKTLNNLDQIRGRLRVSAASAGVGLGGSFDALMQQTALDEALNLQIIDKNRTNNEALIRSGLDADLASIGSRMQNTILAGFMGAVQGSETGLRIGGAINSFGNMPTTTGDRLSGAVDDIGPIDPTRRYA